MSRDSVLSRLSDIVQKLFQIIWQMSESLLSSLDRLSEAIFGSPHCLVMHSVAIVFFVADRPNFCKRQTGSLNLTP